MTEIVDHVIAACCWGGGVLVALFVLACIAAAVMGWLEARAYERERSAKG